MDKELLKIIVKNMVGEVREIKIDGASEEKVDAILKELMDKKVLTIVDAETYTADPKEGWSGIGDPIKVAKSAGDSKCYSWDVEKLKELYKIDWNGKEVE